ncbi:Scr1 family TA system antitoxin-like transcriptional regulator [Plantactinospora solaniradicis]|uniref:Scr1 family TA system antitoxin-like transcriptional regulator n=1 Tax=Plantactinospora solaniradicis TaxID=1723736 RepID=A0ABW1KD95_9ACTN
MDMDMWIRALKAARASAQVSQEALAPMIKYSTSLIAGIETGRRRPTMEFARAADEALDTGGLLVELLDRENRQLPPTWFAPWRAVEEQASCLRSFHPCVVPGLLQTEDYARALISSGGLHSPEEVDNLVAARLERQAVLTGEHPKRFVGVIDEMALRRLIGGREVTRAQLEHLVNLAKQPNITLHVIPADAGAYPGIAGGFMLATLLDTDVVLYLENSMAGQLVDRPDVVDTMLRKWDTVLGLAMPEQISLAMIEKLAGEL